MNKNEIAICSNCEKPLINTFIIPCNEYYCLNCGASYELLDVEHEDITEELKCTKEIYDKVFESIYDYITPYHAYRNNCEKCKDMKEYHSEHMTEKEIIQNEVAWKLLKKIGYDENE